MSTYALALDLQDDTALQAQYIAHHANPWPEVVASLKEVGILNMRIWKWGPRLFMLYEAKDGFVPELDFARYLTLHPRCQEWEDLMTTFQKLLPGTPVGEKWQLMDEIFTL